MSWFSRLFESMPKSPKPFVEVGKARITVVCDDGRTFTPELDGKFWYWWEGRPKFSSARQEFADWCERNGVTGTVNVGNGCFIPLCKVKEITVEFVEHKVEGVRR